ncbi:hypothetical protein [Novosphingobium colocasiae]|uniref:hypothetical protein n=1 Tax=Novosphingobium colocasiae TaxID=1256513 RepID=UPI0035AEF4E0
MGAGGKFEISLIHHDELVRLAQRRVERAVARVACANREDREASAALIAALTARDDWLAANPDDQMEMFDGC